MLCSRWQRVWRWNTKSCAVVGFHETDVLEGRIPDWGPSWVLWSMHSDCPLPKEALFSHPLFLFYLVELFLSCDKTLAANYGEQVEGKHGVRCLNVGGGGREWSNMCSCMSFLGGGEEREMVNIRPSSCSYQAEAKWDEGGRSRQNQWLLVSQLSKDAYLKPPWELRNTIWHNGFKTLPCR